MNTKLPSGTVVIYTTKSGQPMFRAKWRDRTGKQCGPTLGQAWVVREDDEWIPQPGNPPHGYFDEKRAYGRMVELIAEHERALDGGTTKTSAPKLVPIEDLADAYLAYLARGGRAKPSTLQDHRSALAQPGTRKRGRKQRSARIMRQFGGRDARSIPTSDFVAFLDELAIEGLAPRTVNKYREILHAMYEFGKRPGTFGLAHNPVSETEKLRADGPGPIETFTLDELEAIADSARRGEHHDRPKGNYGPAVLKEWQRLNDQDAAIFLLAAFTGLRQGEIRALRWLNVDLAGRRLTVDSAISAGELSTTKGRRMRTVPLTEAACEQIETVASRRRWKGRNDFVFCGATGEIIDGAMLSKRFRRTQKVADVRVRRFHDLRHTFGSTAVRRFDLATVKELMGHAHITTTERYLHSRPRAEDASKLAQAFESSRETRSEKMPREPGKHPDRSGNHRLVSGALRFTGPRSTITRSYR